MGALGNASQTRGGSIYMGSKVASLVASPPHTPITMSVASASGHDKGGELRTEHSSRESLDKPADVNLTLLNCTSQFPQINAKPSPVSGRQYGQPMFALQTNTTNMCSGVGILAWMSCLFLSVLWFQSWFFHG